MKNVKTDLQRLFPLFLIFGYIPLKAMLLNTDPWNGSLFLLEFMGLFYFVFTILMRLDLTGFPEAIEMYEPLADVAQ